MEMMKKGKNIKIEFRKIIFQAIYHLPDSMLVSLSRT